MFARNHCLSNQGMNSAKSDLELIQKSDTKAKEIDENRFTSNGLIKGFVARLILMELIISYRCFLLDKKGSINKIYWNIIMTSTRTKRQKLHFEWSCKCKNHQVIVAKYNEDPYHVYTIRSKDYSWKSCNYLVSKGLLTNCCNYICHDCLKYATDHLSEENGKEMPSTGHKSIDDNTEDLSTVLEESIIKSIDELMKQVEEAKNFPISDKLNGKIKSVTSFIITNFVRPAVTIAIKIISSNYKDLNYLKHIDSTERANTLELSRKIIVICFC